MAIIWQFLLLIWYDKHLCSSFLHCLILLTGTLVYMSLIVTYVLFNSTLSAATFTLRCLKTYICTSTAADIMLTLYAVAAISKWSATDVVLHETLFWASGGVSVS